MKALVGAASNKEKAPIQWALSPNIVNIDVHRCQNSSSRQRGGGRGEAGRRAGVRGRELAAHHLRDGPPGGEVAAGAGRHTHRRGHDQAGGQSRSVDTS